MKYLIVSILNTKNGTAFNNTSVVVNGGELEERHINEIKEVLMKNNNADNAIILNAIPLVEE